MAILNRRNAVLGWLAWRAGKRIAKRKARAAVPSVDAETKRPNRAAAVVAVLAAVGGGLFFWRRRSEDHDSSDPLG
jgi:hypothetical protein